MNILGISTSLHDPSSALLVDGKIAAAAEEERFIRIKHASTRLPLESARFCMDHAKLKPSDIDLIVYPWSPDLYNKYKYKQSARFLKKPRTARSIFIGNRGHMKNLRTILKTLGFAELKTKVEFVEHHLAHQSSAYHLSGFENAALMSIDGRGEFVSTLFSEGKNGEIEKIEEFTVPASLGYFYSAFTEYLGFRANNGEFKVMGMSAYGDASKVDLSDFMGIRDGKLWVDDNHIGGPTTRVMVKEDRRYSDEIIKRWGPPREGDGLKEPYIHISAAVQKSLEDAVLELMDTHLGDVLKKTGTLCFAGGTALNVRLNRKIIEHGTVKDIFVQPASHDGGISLGGATYIAHQLGEKVETQKHSYYGPEYSDKEILSVVKKSGLKYEKVDDIVSESASRLAKGEAVSWFQGRMEWGPRALGNRSILGHPAHPGISKDINARIKFREDWRPFCPSILADAAPDILENYYPSPYMNLSFRVKKNWWDRIPEIIHVDKTARPQTVEKKINPFYYKLIKEFEEETDIPLLLNTSLNRRGEPMVCSPKDAVAMLKGSGLKTLAMGNYMVYK